jgi:acyl transferase domain-containing protein/acyl carrier protein
VGMDAYFGTGISRSIAAGRISYLLGLHGPSMAIDTACSSSAIATHLACQSLWLRESDLALAGGANLTLIPDGSISASRARMMSFTGRCRAFAASADGYVRAEGCAMLALRRLPDALADGDNILAVILGSSVNQDGRSNGITAPNGQAQEQLLRTALAEAGLTPGEVTVIEAHGTGTTLGDPIEMRAIAAVYGTAHDREHPLLVTSVKTNLGHTEAVAGTAGLLKLVLALQHGVVPPHLHLDEPNPLIPWADMPVAIPTVPTPWAVRDGARRVAGVSSFGFSGTNSHILVAEPPRRPARVETPRPCRVLTISARSPAALGELAGRYAAVLPELDAPFSDVTFTAHTGRTHYLERLAVRAASAADAASAIAAWRDGAAPAGVARGTGNSGLAPEIAFLFTGQGAQYAGMGRRLYDVEPVFRAALDHCAALLRPHLDRPLLAVIHPADGDDARLIDRTGYTQPALFALEYALAELWRARGVEPALVVGHSVGEYVAACVAGVFSLEDGLALIAARGRLMQALPPGGAMAAVFTEEETAAAAIAPFAHELAIAAVNGPRSIVISGAAAAVEAVLGRLAEEGVSGRMLNVSHAFHSPLIEPMLEDFRAAASRITYAPPRIGLVSNVTGRLAGSEIAGADYWVRHVRAPVRFADAVRTLAAEGCTAFVEVGPAPTLIGMAERCIDPQPVASLPSLRRDTDEVEQMLDSLAALHVHGVDVDWPSVDGADGQRRVPLPTYPYQRQRYWANFDSLHTAPERRSLRPLLDERLRSPVVAGHLFQSRLGRARPAYLDDHRIFDVPLFPATGFIELFRAAAMEAFGAAGPLEHVQFREALPLPDAGDVTVQVAVGVPADGRAELSIFSLQNADTDTWKLHATAHVRLAAAEAAGVAAGAAAAAEAAGVAAGAAAAAEAAGAGGVAVAAADAAGAAAGAAESVAAAAGGVAVSAGAALDDVRGRCTEPFDARSFYAALADVGVGYGAVFCALREVLRRDGEAVARIALPEALAHEAALYQLHPALLDACLQLLGPAVAAMADGRAVEEVYVPVDIRRCTLHRGGATAIWCHAALDVDASAGELLCGDVRVFDADGALIGELSGVTLRRVSREAVERTRGTLPAERLEHWLHDVAWEAAEAAEPAGDWAAGNWLILADDGGTGDALAGRLRAAGGACVLAYRADLDVDDPQARAALIDSAAHHGTGVFRGIVHLWSADIAVRDDAAATLADYRSICGSTLALVQAAIGRVQPGGLWLVTRGAHALPGETQPVVPAQTALWGLGTTIHAELPELRCVCIDLGRGTALDAAGAISRELAAPDAEHRVAWRATGRHVARLVRHSAAAAGLRVGGAVELAIGSSGMLDTFELRPAERRPPGPGEVEIEVEASGLNFRDVLNALGMYPGDAGPLGSECAGTVVAAGEGVTGCRPGDRVIVLAPGSFRSHLTVPARSVHPAPAWLRPAEAAGMPIVFLTAWYGLHELARMKAGDRVLIHAAAGGVGLAAVQLARRAGAVVYATAGSDDKHEFLRSIGVEHVMSSRSLDFAADIMQSTGGSGVDIVLNALADEFIPASLGVLADGGCFLEIGKRGIWTTDQVAALNPTLRYHAYDLAEALGDEHWYPHTMDLLAAAFETGELTTLPLQEFPLARAGDAFRYMARAKHIGKIVLTQSRAAAGAAVPRDDATYLITGGLGGLGLEVARWLAQAGAHSVALMGRRAPDDRARELIAQLEATGVSVLTVQGDVASAADVARALADIEAALPPLRGIIHAAGVIDDALLPQQTWEHFEAVLRPKVLGGWNLHTATRDLPLDFFVLFSTGSAFMGSAGQANYAAANAFLDGLAHHRRARGLPATSINWGPWSDVGMAAALSDREARRWRSSGLDMIPPADGVRVLERLLHELPTQVAVLPFDWARFARAVGAVPPFFSAVARPAESRAPVRQPDVRDALRTAEPNARLELLKRHVHERVASVLGIDSSAAISPSQGLSDLGMDSLMAVELSNQLQASLGCKLPSTIAFEYPTLAALSAFLAGEVLEQGAGDGGATPSSMLAVDAAADEAAAARTAAARRLTDEEAELTLLQELERAGY